MIGIGIIIVTAGYAVGYWGSQLFAGTPVSFAYALGFSQTNSAPQPGAVAPPILSSTTTGTTAGASSAGKGLSSKHPPKTGSARSVPAGKGRPPEIAS
jgi:hypothetical protein